MTPLVAFGLSPLRIRSARPRAASSVRCLAASAVGGTPAVVFSLAILVGLADFARPAAALAAPPETALPYAPSRRLHEDASLHAVAFANQRVGLAVGDCGVILRTNDAGQSWQMCDSGVDCRLDDLLWLDESWVVAVGGGYDRITRLSRGAVLISRDAGLTWRRGDDSELPRFHEIRPLADAGSPDRSGIIAVGDWSPISMTQKFISRDDGRTWQGGDGWHHDGILRSEPSVAQRRRWADALGTAATIRDFCRTGEQHVWAVGDHGVILHSPDRGRSWETQRGSGRHASVLVVAQTPRTVAWSVVGNETLEMRNRVSILLLDSGVRDQASGSSLDVSRQVAAAFGAASVDPLSATASDPLRSTASTPLAGSKQLADSKTQSMTTSIGESLPDWLVVHQPSAILLDTSIARENRDEIVRLAIAAGVPRIVSYALVPRVGSVGPRQSQMGAVSVGRPVPQRVTHQGDSMLHHNALLPRSGVLAGDLGDDALHWVSPLTPAPGSVSLKWIYDASGTATRGESLVAGLPLSTATTLHAPAAEASRHQLQIAQARLRESERLTELLSNSSSASSFSASLKRLADQAATADRFRLLWSTLRRTLQRHDVQLQLAVLDQISSSYQDESAGRWAALRRDALGRSVEWNRARCSNPSIWNGRGDQGAGASGSPMAHVTDTVAVSPFQLPAAPLSVASEASLVPVPSAMASSAGAARRVSRASRASATGATGAVRQASAVAPLLVPRATQLEMPSQDAANAAASDRPGNVDLAWQFHPLVLLAQEADRHQSDSGTLEPAGKVSADLRRLSNSESSSAWGELLGVQGRRVLGASAVSQPPHLDGVLNDSCWAAEPIVIDDRTSVRMAYDEEFIYVAVDTDSERFADEAVSPDRWDVSRDHDLTAVDRLEVSLDIDMDVVTAMRLQVSGDGRTFDSVDTHPGWQPTWYVAPRRDSGRMVFELAILRRDVMELPIYAGQSWFVKIRTIQGSQQALDARQSLHAGTAAPDSVMPVASDLIRVDFQ